MLCCLLQLEDRLDAGSPAVIAFVESILALGVEESVSIKMQPSEESLAGTPHSPTFDSGVDHLNNTHDYVNNVADGQHGSNLIPLNHCGDSMQSTTGSHETKSLPLDVHDRIIDTVTTIVERRNARERKALQEVKAKTGAARIAYNREWMSYGLTILYTLVCRLVESLPSLSTPLGRNCRLPLIFGP